MGSDFKIHLNKKDIFCLYALLRHSSYVPVDVLSNVSECNQFDLSIDEALFPRHLEGVFLNPITVHNENVHLIIVVIPTVKS